MATDASLGADGGERHSAPFRSVRRFLDTLAWAAHAELQVPAPIDFVANIRAKGISIYEPIRPSDPSLWIPDTDLQRILITYLHGTSFAGLPLRTRSKVVKSAVCRALGYPEPKSFTKSIPRFPGQDLEVYSQKSTNLQVWNQELAPERRYAIIKLSKDDVVEIVKVVRGSVLEALDTTGTLTTKFQARLTNVSSPVELISSRDTEVLAPHVVAAPELAASSPVDYPRSGQLFSIASLAAQLKQLVGVRFKDSGIVSERTRGGVLHALAAEALGYRSHADNGQFPDILHQLLEVKLQMAATIDLGRVAPDSEEAIKLHPMSGKPIRHCDVRYALFKAELAEDQIVIKNVLLTTGADFFSRFPQFGGKITNSKIQIPLPSNFYS